MIPARGGLGWAWCTLAWAVMVRPTISAVAAMVMTAVIQRRIRRVIAVSLLDASRGRGITGGSKPRRRRMVSQRRAGRRPPADKTRKPARLSLPGGTVGDMANRITAIAIDCADPESLARFWTAVLGWQVTERDEGIVSIGAPGSPFGIDFVRVPEPKQVKNRVHLDVNATDRDQDAELRRLLE